jgi:hypothetical protein
MSTLREAAQQALEALREYVPREDYENKPVGNVMEALRTALAEPEQEQKHIGPEWVPCVKLPVTVHVREQRPGEAHVSTREGITPIRPDDLIMRGVAGEEYPIGRELFNRTYRLGEQRTEPEQEPVALIRLKTESRFIRGSDMGLGCSDGYVTDRYLAIEFVNYTMHNPAKSLFRDGDVLYTHPPQRKPLTDEEIVEHFQTQVDTGSLLSFVEGVRYAERAHGIGGEA